MALQPAPSAARTVETVRFLAEHPGEEFPVAVLARCLGLSRATCQSVLLALEPPGWVVRTAGGYRIGPGLIAVGAAAKQGATVVGLLRDSIAVLHERTGCEVIGYLPAGDRLINVGRIGSNRPGSMTMVEGQSFPLAPPNGLAFAAWDDQALEAWLDRAEGASAATRKRLRRAAQMVRQLGYSVILDPVTRRELRSELTGLSAARQEFIASALDHDDLVVTRSVEVDALRVSLLSGPVFDSDGRVAALIGVVFNAGERSRLAGLVSDLKLACLSLSRRLGAPAVGALEDRTA